MALLTVSSNVCFVFRAETFARDKKQLSTLVPQPFSVEGVTVEADVLIDRQEIDYLIDIRAGDLIGAEKLELALSHLMQKNKFASVELCLQGDELNKSIHFVLVGGWTLSKLKLRGVSVGRDLYKLCYLIEQGDLFDEAKHQLSLKKLGEYLRANGYFNGTVSDRIERFSDTKTIIVHLLCDLKDRFSVTSSRLVLADSAQQSGALGQSLYNNYIKGLERSYYDKKAFAQRAAALQDALVKQGYFQAEISLTENIFSQKNSVELLWRINLGLFKKFEFVGNSFFSQQELLNQLLPFGKSVLLVPTAILLQEIGRFYKTAGFLDSTIVEDEQRRDHVLFMITEGPRALVREIVLHNTFYFNKDQLVADCFADLLKGRYAQEKLINDGAAAVVDRYVKEGFLEAKILASKMVPLDNPAHYQLEVVVEEGVRYAVASVQVVDFPELTDALSEAFVTQETHYVTTECIAQQEAFLRDALARLSIDYTRISSELVRLDDTLVNVIWHVQRASKATTFGKTIIVSNEKNPFSYVMHMRTYQEGELWNQEKLKTTFMALKDLSVFDSITIMPAWQSATDNTRDVFIRVQLDDPFEVRVRGGVELQQVERYQTLAWLAYKVGATFIVKNPAQSGDCLNFEIDWGRFHHEFVTRYRYPWPFGMPVKAAVQAYSTFYDQPTFYGSRKNIYGIKQHGIVLEIDKEFNQAKVNVTLGFEWLLTGVAARSEKNFARAVRLAKAINFDLFLLGKGVPYFLLEPSLILDKLDNKLNPTAGSFSLVSCKIMAPLAHEQTQTFFAKVLAEHSYFTSINQVVVALRARVGHIFYRAFCAISPVDRFYLGGSHSLRGYDTDLAPPLGLFEECEGKKVLVPQGGKSMANVNAELRIPIVRDLDGVVFTDLGVLAGDKWAFVLSEGLLGSSGFGVRFKTPIGPLRFDIGWKWHKRDPLEQAYAWFLSLGQSF